MDDGVSPLQTALEQKLVLAEQPYWTQWARSWRRHVLASPNLHLRPQDETTLSVLGSSVAAGCEVSPGYSFPVRMAAHLQELGIRVRVQNGAQGASRSMYSTLLLESLYDTAALTNGIIVWEYALSDVQCGVDNRSNYGPRATAACSLATLLSRLQSLRPLLVVLAFFWPCGWKTGDYLADDSFFGAVRHVLKQYAQNMPLIALNVPGWLQDLASNSSAGCVLEHIADQPRVPLCSYRTFSRFRGPNCHPSRAAHEIVANVLAQSILQRSNHARHSLGTPLVESNAQETAATDPARQTECSGIASPITSRILCTRHRYELRSFLSWRPTFRSVGATLLPLELRGGRGAPPVQVKAVGKCGETGRADCKVGIRIPPCTKGAANASSSSVTFDLGNASKSWVTALHWKAVGRIRVEYTDVSGTIFAISANRYRYSDGCLRTTVWWPPNLSPDLFDDDWWLPPQPVAIRAFHFCIEGARQYSNEEAWPLSSMQSLHWLAVAAATSRELATVCSAKYGRL